MRFQAIPLRAWRLPAAALAGTVITVGLFWFMTRLIAGGPSVNDQDRLPGIYFVDHFEREETAVKSRVRPRRPLRMRETPPAPTPRPIEKQPPQPFALDQFSVSNALANYQYRPTPMGTPRPWSVGNVLAARSLMHPIYPHRALLKGIEGQVTVGFEIDHRGNVSRAWIVEATPPEIFDRAAIAAVMKWRFQPPTDDSGESGFLVAEQVIDFRLLDGT